jgi:hypothetical protein
MYSLWLYIVSFFKILNQGKPLLDFIKIYKGHCKLLLILFVTSCLCLFYFIDYQKEQKDYDSINFQNVLENKIDNILYKCGDKTAISIGKIKIFQNIDNQSWNGVFLLARACDIRMNERNCIVNLKDRHPSLYKKEQNIGLNSYNLLVNVGKQDYAMIFNLNKKGLQNLTSLNNFPSIKEIIEKTEWSDQKILKNMWLTSILNKNNSVLYVIIFLSGKERNQLNCLDQEIILRGIKELMR